jgi:lipoate-protein ligase A
MTKPTWRLISYQSHDAFANMAIDEALLDCHIRYKTAPVLRFYGFAPKAVSIGHSQVLAPQVLENIRSHGYDIVRRPSGGRAVLHDGELTYSFVGTSVGSSSILDTDTTIDTDSGAEGNEGFLESSVQGAYAQICRGLEAGFSLLGQRAMLGSSGTAYRHLQDCFMASGASDLQLQGKKIVGSAQLRRQLGVLQHGSIILRQPQDLMHRLLSSDAELSQSSKNTELSQSSNSSMLLELELKPRHANLFDILGQDLDIAELETLFTKGFSTAFDVEFVLSDLSVEELNLSKELYKKYAEGLWALS